MNEQGIKTFNKLNILIIKQGLSIPARIWYLLREFDTDGHGYVEKRDFSKYLKSIGLSKTVWITARNHPEAKIFYTDNNTRIHYKGLEKVCQSLLSLPGLPVYIPQDSFSSLSSFNAYLYATFFADRKRRSKFISRKKLTDIFGITKQCQINYEKIAGIRVETCIVSAKIPKKCYNNPLLEQQFIESLPIPSTDDDSNYSPWWRSKGCIYWQTANKYYANLKVGKTGKTSRIRIRGDIYNGHIAPKKKRFFVSNRQVNRYREYKHQGCFVETQCYIKGQHKSKSRLLQYTDFMPVATKEQATIDPRLVSFDRQRLSYFNESKRELEYYVGRQHAFT